jgi:virulence-associated protein VagC
MVAIVSVDSQRRIYLPKGLDFEAKKALIIPRGDEYILLPIPDEIVEIDVDVPVEELRARAEEKAKREAEHARRI